MSDPMRDQIRRLDPMPPDVRTIADSDPEAHELLERIMTNPIDQQTQAPDPGDRRQTRQARRAWPAVAAVGLVGVVAIAVVGVGLGRGSAPASPTPAVAVRPASPTPAPAVRLALPVFDAAGSCPIFDVADLKRAPIAFGGTVTAIGKGLVEIRVDRWYRGGTAPTVQLEAPAPDSVALDGLAFEVGGRYLVSAIAEAANGCGLSGPLSPELQAAFEQAFGS